MAGGAGLHVSDAFYSNTCGCGFLVRRLSNNMSQPCSSRIPAAQAVQQLFTARTMLKLDACCTVCSTACHSPLSCKTVLKLLLPGDFRVLLHRLSNNVSQLEPPSRPPAAQPLRGPPSYEAATAGRTTATAATAAATAASTAATAASGTAPVAPDATGTQTPAAGMEALTHSTKPEPVSRDEDEAASGRAEPDVAVDGLEQLDRSAEEALQIQVSQRKGRPQ